MVINALRKHGFERRGAAEIVRETVEITRKLLRGENVQYDGSRFKIPPPGTRLELDRLGTVPVYVGATGPEMLKLAGQYADGVLLNYPCTPGFIEQAMGSIQEGLSTAGRTLQNFTVAAYLLISVDDDHSRAVNAAKQFIAKKLPTRHPEMLRYAGVTQEEISRLTAAIANSGIERAAVEIDDDIVKRVAVAGTPDSVIAGIKQFAATGLTLPIVWEIVGPDRFRSLDLIAREVMPRLKD
jgi:5,10-methylenetetrahydromethanopterin reductase